MSNQWFYESSGRQLGPLDDDMVKELIRGRDIRATNLVWRQGMTSWLPCSEVPELAQYLPPSRVAPPSPEVAAAMTMPTAPPPMPAAAAVAVAAAAPQYNAWTPLAEPPAAAPVLAGGTSHFCAVCGQSFAESDMIHYMGSWICANCKPAFFQRMREGAGGTGGGLGFAHYAGFWIRFVAWIIDYIITSGVGFVLGLFVGMLGVAASKSGAGSGIAGMMAQTTAGIMGLCFSLGYYIFFDGTYGATPGKMAVGIKIVTATGEKIGYGRAAGRFLAKILSGCILAIGYIIVGFDEEKRALHDHICSTRVIYK